MKTFEVESFDGAHPGRTIWIVGCGPSLRNWAPCSVLFGEHVCIFINTSIHHVAWNMNGREDFYRIIFDRTSLRDYFKFPYYRNTEPKIQRIHTFMPVHVYLSVIDEEEAFMNGTSWSFFQTYGFDPFKYPLVRKHLFYPTLFSAMSLGLRMGAATLKLVGVDYGPVNGVTHWDRQADVEKTKVMGQYQRKCMAEEMLMACARYGTEVERWRSPDERYED